MVETATIRDEEELFSRARATFLAALSTETQPAIDRKIEDLSRYNVEAINRVAAICNWGRSGSLLLASYLDGHDHVIMLPTTSGQEIYTFFERYSKQSLWNKLIAYPLFANHPFFERNFHGDFTIDPADYYIAVKAMFEVFSTRPSEFLESRKTFFQFLHVAYSLALGRRLATLEPIIIHAQHSWDSVLAVRLVEDFPEARFIHTVRDPISNIDREFEWSLRWQDFFFGSSPKFSFSSIPSAILRSFLASDHPHPGMESRTTAIRFEDLHLDTAKVLGRLMDWLGLPFHDSLSASTFNGKPYTAERNGVVWSGARPEQAQRSSQNISFVDRALIFSLFYDDFTSWNYPCPKIFRNPAVRRIVGALILVIPMKMEFIAAWAVIKVQVVPSLRSGNVRLAMTRAARVVYYRLAMMSFVATECFRQLRTKKITLRPLLS
jgi:hypothetical protein